MKKVAQFIDALDPGGAESLIIELGKHLPRLGFSCEVLHFGNVWLESRCGDLGIPCFTVPAYKQYKAWRSLPKFAAEFGRFIERRGIDILHSHLIGAILGGALAGKYKKISHVGTIHDIYSIEENRASMVMLQAASIMGTRLVSVSETINTEILRRKLAWRMEIRTIVNGIDINRYCKKKTTECKEQLGIHPHETVLVTVARFVEIKRLDVLIHAFSLLRHNENKIRLLLVGDGPCRTRLEDLINTLGLGEQAIFVGFRRDVPDLLSAADIFVSSSDSEGLSFSIAEAMAAKLPIVATDVGGNRELVDQEVSGFLVEPNDPDQLARRIQKLVDDKALRTQMGEAGFQLVRSKFSIELTAENYAAFYKEVLLEK